MQIDAIRGVKGNTDGDFDTPVIIETAASTPAAVATAGKVQPVSTVGRSSGAIQEDDSEGKDPSVSTIDSVVSEANQKMRLTKTRCEYSYDEPTKRVSIKVYDKDTDKLIREVPPEKSLEMLQKMWELAGIIVDEKR
ncbi:MAG: flagellar protein FlaG [Lachnospiraceae bacterium]|nr:flagellar protein FlaG [Lachnospiraceae bacterium]